MRGFGRQAVGAWFLLWAMSAVASAAPAEVHLASGERLRVTALVYDGQVLVAESPYGQLLFPKEQLRFVVWGELPDRVPELAEHLVLADGTHLRAAAQRIGPDGVVARTSWGTVVINDLKSLRSVGFAELQPAPQPPDTAWEFLFTDGSVLRGRLLRFEGERMVIETAFATIGLPSRFLAEARSRSGVSADPSGVVVFATGERLAATFQQATEHAWMFDIPGGKLVVDTPQAIALVTMRAPVEVPTLPPVEGPAPRSIAIAPRIARWIAVDVARSGKLSSIMVRPTGTSALVATSNGVAEIDLATGKAWWTVGCYNPGVVSVPEPNQATFALICSGDWRLEWRTSREKLYSFPLAGTPVSTALTTDKRYAFVGTTEGHVEVLALWRGVWVDRVGRGVAGPSYVAVSPDDRWLAIAYAGARKLEFHDMEDPYILTRHVVSVALDESPVALLISPDKGHLYVLDARGMTAYEWGSDRVITRASVTLGPQAILLPGERFALSGREDRVCTVDLQSGKAVGCVRVAGFHSMALGPDGKSVYATGAEGISVIVLAEGTASAP